MLKMKRKHIVIMTLLVLMVYWVGAVLEALAIGLLVFHGVWHIDNFFEKCCNPLRVPGV